MAHLLNIFLSKKNFRRTVWYLPSRPVPELGVVK